MKRLIMSIALIASGCLVACQTCYMPSCSSIVDGTMDPKCCFGPCVEDAPDGGPQ